MNKQEDRDGEATFTIGQTLQAPVEPKPAQSVMLDPSEAPTVRINLHDECSAHAPGFTIEPIDHTDSPTVRIRFQSPTVPLPHTSVPAIDSHARALDRFARVTEATFRKFAADGSVGRDGLNGALASALATEITAQAEQPNAPDFRIDMPGDGTFDITVNGERKRYNLAEPHDRANAIDAVTRLPEFENVKSSAPWRVVDSWDAVEGDCVHVWDIKGPPPFDGIRARDEYHAEDLVTALNATVKVPGDESKSAPTEVQVFPIDTIPQDAPEPRRGFTLEPFDGTSMEFTIESASALSDALKTKLTQCIGQGRDEAFDAMKAAFDEYGVTAGHVSSISLDGLPLADVVCPPPAEASVASPDKRDELITKCARLHMVLSVTHQDLRTVMHAMPGVDPQIAALASAEAMARWRLTDCPAPGPELTIDDIDAAKERWS